MATKKKSRRTSLADLPEALVKLVKLLQRKGGTALSLAGKLGISKPTVYAQLNRLRDEHSYTLLAEDVREGTKGPLAKHYTTR